MTPPGVRAALLAAVLVTAGPQLRAEGPWTATPGAGANWTQATVPPTPPAPLAPSEMLPPPRSVAPDVPAPKPVAPPAPTAKPLPKVELPVPPPASAPAPLPVPVYRVAPVAAPELEPWPGIVPAVGQSRGGVVGSPNLTLSRDYSVLDLFGVGLFGEDSRTAVVGRPASARQSFVQAEFLLWWVRAGNVPVLASTASGQEVGYLGMASTQTLLGPGSFGDTSRTGFRLRAGTLLGESGSAGIDAGFFYLGEKASDFRVDSGQFPTIARPFFAPNFNREFAELVAFPGLSTGALEVRTASQLWGADVNTRCVICTPCDSRREFFAGYRHLNLREELTIAEFITAGPNAPDPAGTSIVVQDSFRTRNQFHGGQIGYAFGRSFGAVEFDARLSVALGVTHQEVEIDGVQTRTRPGQVPENFRGGLLAAGPNLGTFTRNAFSVAPEATVNVGVRLTDRLKTYVGYNFLAWSNVVRPGDQIDRTVDLSFVPNGPRVPLSANRPVPTFQQSDLWAHGVQFGLEYRW